MRRNRTRSRAFGPKHGENEALELRDGDRNWYMSKGVQKAVTKVNTKIGAALIGMGTFNQVAVDRAILELDGRETKSKLGANAILAVSLPTAKAAAPALGQPLFRSWAGRMRRCCPCRWQT